MDKILIGALACVFLVGCVGSPIFVVATPGNIPMPESTSSPQPVNPENNTN